MSSERNRRRALPVQELSGLDLQPSKPLLILHLTPTLAPLNVIISITQRVEYQGPFFFFFEDKGGIKDGRRLALYWGGRGTPLQ